MLIHIPKILSSEQLAHCRQLLASANWIDGRASAGHVAGTVKKNQEIPKNDPAISELRELVTNAIMSKQHFVATAFPAQIVPPSFSRYEAGQSYGMHVDAGVMDVIEPAAIRRVRTDLAATLFLNEPADYEGGELSVNDQLYGQGHAKLPAGDMVLYPACSQHCVLPLSKGIRLVSFFWIQSMIRDESLRLMLRELDSAIQQLNRSTTEGPVAAKLLCLYHNLLRLWSEPC